MSDFGRGLQAMRKRVLKTCGRCGKEFEGIVRRTDERAFCSPQCRSLDYWHRAGKQKRAEHRASPTPDDQG